MSSTEAVQITPTTAQVPIKSAWYSKINWTQLISILAMIAAYFGLNISPDEQVSVVVTIGIVCNIVTVVLRTFFNGSVTPSSLDKPTV